MNFEILRSKRKTMTIHVFRNQRVQVRAPLRCKDDEIASFFAKHRPWIVKKLQEFKQYPGLEDSQYTASGSLWLIGKSYPISVIKGSKNQVKLTEQELVVEQCETTDSSKTIKLITKWKRDFASEMFQRRLVYWAEQFPVTLKEYQFRIRKMKRQWGNCSHRGVITINSQLIRYPQSCIDYVIIHELTHLKHLNHGKAFYYLLEQVMPQWRQHKQLLSEFSGSEPLDE